MELNAEILSHVVRICDLVEGMPLGIELAATWADVLSPREIADEIEHSLDILEATRRHISYSENSMRAAFARSWSLLNDTQKAAFRRLSVFRGGFTRKAVEGLIGANLRTLQALVSKSLLRYNPDTGRYTIHELLRQYAQEQLVMSGEASEIYETHATYFAEFMAERWRQMKGPRQKTALLEVEADIENARAAWSYWIGKANILQLKKFFHSFWVIHDIRGWYPAGIEIFEQGVTMVRAVDTEEARSGLGWLFAAQGLYSVAGGEGARKGFELAQQGVQILDGLKRRDEMVIPLISLFVTANQVNEGHVAVQAAYDCLKIASEIGDRWGEAKAKQFLGMRAIEDGDYERADQLGQEALAIFVDSGDTWSKCILCIELLGMLAITVRQWELAAEWIKRGLRAAEAIDFKYSMQMAYWQLGYVEALQDNYLEAGKYWRMALGVGDRVIGGKSIIGFGGSSSSGEWGGRTLINELEIRHNVRADRGKHYND
jgi:tetratricopeptide (TPR) repeat protein